MLYPKVYNGITKHFDNFASPKKGEKRGEQPCLKPSTNTFPISGKTFSPFSIRFGRPFGLPCRKRRNGSPGGCPPIGKIRTSSTLRPLRTTWESTRETLLLSIFGTGCRITVSARELSSFPMTGPFPWT